MHQIVGFALLIQPFLYFCELLHLKTPQQIVHKAQSDLWAEFTTVRGVWSTAMMDSGGLFVTTTGTVLMPVWFAGN